MILLLERLCLVKDVEGLRSLSLQVGPEEEEEEVRVGEGEEEVVLILTDWIRRIRCLDRDPFLDYHGQDQRPVNPRHATRADPYHGFRKGSV